MSSNRISVVSAANEAYAPHLAAMLHSLFQRTESRIDFYLLHRPNLAAGVVERLDSLCRQHGATLQSVVVPAERLLHLRTLERYPVEAWYRLMLPSLLPDVGRVLWLDADLIVMRAVKELWETNLNGSILAAVPNAMLPHHWDHVSTVGMQADRRNYFNTGVMLLDLDGWRQQDAERSLRELSLQLGDRVQFADQDILNAAFNSRYKKLHLPWNVTTGTYFNVRETVRMHGMTQFRVALRNPRIIHFTLLKPWLERGSHPYRDQYLEHRAAAGWPPLVRQDRLLAGLLYGHHMVPMRILMAKLRRGRFSEALQVARTLVPAGTEVADDKRARR